MEELKTAYQVYTTNDYSKFKRLVGNRDISESRLNKIVTSIKTVGWIKNPIVVNENYEVIDGQGRLTALKRLGLPVEYVIAEGAGTQECIFMNIGMVNWKQPDFIKSYAEQGNENYQRLLKLMDTYVNGNLHIIFTALYRISKPKHREIKAGTLQVTEQQYTDAVKRLEYIQPILDQIRADRLPGSVITLMQTLIYYYDYEEVNKKRLAENVKKYVYKCNPWVTNQDCEKEVEEVYNYHISFTKKQSIQYLIRDEKIRQKVENNKKLSKLAIERTQKGVQGFQKASSNSTDGVANKILADDEISNYIGSNKWVETSADTESYASNKDAILELRKMLEEGDIDDGK